MIHSLLKKQSDSEICIYLLFFKCFLNYTKCPRKSTNKQNVTTSLLLVLDQFTHTFREATRKVNWKRLLQNGHYLHKRTYMWKPTHATGGTSENGTCNGVVCNQRKTHNQDHIHQRNCNWCKLLAVTSREFGSRTRIHQMVNTYYFMQDDARPNTVANDFLLLEYNFQDHITVLDLENINKSDWWWNMAIERFVA